jgi:hypothetical protein
MKQKTLKQLQVQLDDIEEMIKIGNIYRGKVSLGNEIVSVKELEEMRESIKFEIASRISQTKLRLVK